MADENCLCNQAVHADVLPGYHIPIAAAAQFLIPLDMPGQGKLLQRGQSILEDMDYTHGNSYASCMQTLEETDNAIANASLNGTEYYLCLHQMMDTDWVLLLAMNGHLSKPIVMDEVVKAISRNISRR